MRLNLNEAGDRWVELREPHEVTEAGRRNFKIYAAAASRDDLDPLVKAEFLVKSDDCIIAMFVREWSLGDPIPQAQIERLHELPALEYDLLSKACRERTDATFGDFSATEEDLADDAPLDSPFLAAGTPEVGVGGGPESAADGPPAAAAGVSGADPAVADREADPLVKG